jgi:hypothetical protein
LEEASVHTYVILRRGGWRSPEELGEAAERSRRVGDEEMSDDIRWIRSYVLEEDGGSVGTVCIYQATSPEAIREHASAAELPVDEIIRVVDTVIVRPDPALLPPDSDRTSAISLSHHLVNQPSASATLALSRQQEEE